MNHHTTHARAKLLEGVSKLASSRVEDAVIWAKIIKLPVLKKKANDDKKKRLSLKKIIKTYRCPMLGPEGGCSLV